jgi:HEAT repeat protein
MGFFSRLFGTPDPKKMEARGDVEGLIKALNHPEDINLQVGSAEALGRLGGERAVEALIDALMNSQIHWVRYAAAKGLGAIGDPRALVALIAALKDPVENLRYLAVQALGMLGDRRAVAPLKQAVKKKLESSLVRNEATLALIKLGALEYEELVALLNNSVVRAVAAEALGLLGDRRAIAPLVHALNRHYDNLPIIAALGRLSDGDGSIAGELVGWLCSYGVHDEEYSAIYAVLINLHDAVGVEALIELLTSTDRDFRVKAAEILVEWYTTDVLDEECRMRVLHNKDTITAPHRERRSERHGHLDQTCSLGHFDQAPGHCDTPETGIGVRFPLF